MTLERFEEIASEYFGYLPNCYEVEKLDIINSEAFVKSRLGVNNGCDCNYNTYVYEQAVVLHTLNMFKYSPEQDKRTVEKLTLDFLKSKGVYYF